MTKLIAEEEKWDGEEAMNEYGDEAFAMDPQPVEPAASEVKALLLFDKNRNKLEKKLKEQTLKRH